jgi:uncharacterized protein (TIGR02391 family)
MESPGGHMGLPASGISSPDEVEADVQALLRCVHGVFGPSGEWPIHFFVESALEGEIDRDLDTVLEQAPPGLLGVSLPARNDTPIVLRIAGLVHCAGAENDVSLFLWLLRWCVAKQRDFRPSQPTAVEELQVSARELAADLKADGHELSKLKAKKAHAFLISERIHAGLNGDPDDWTLTLSRKMLKPYFQVQTLEDYLALVATKDRPQPPPANPLLQSEILGPALPVVENVMRIEPARQGQEALEVDDLHQVVREACGRLFAGGHYSEGVLAAAKAMCRVVRATSGLRMSDDYALTGKALGGKEPSIQVGDPNTDTGRNIQRGTLLLTQGIIARLRNPLTHEEIEPSREEAMEMVGMISRVVRDLSAAGVRKVDGH